MARVMGSARSMYTKDKVQTMRSERKHLKPTKPGVSDKDYQYYLGDLIGAGHLTIEGFNGMKTEIRNPMIGANFTHRQIELITPVLEDRKGERPHMSGYLQSGHPKDPFFRIKGWFNEDGTIRIELVK